MTRKTAAASKPPKPTKPKRPKPAASRPATPGEEFYAIRDILDERRIDDGILQYHVDWADNPTTGERYDPTWVCYSGTFTHITTLPALPPLPAPAPAPAPAFC